MDLKSLLVSADVPSQVAVEVRRQLSGTGTKVAANAREAEASLRILAESTDKVIQSLTGAGRVFDYRLLLKVRYHFRLTQKRKNARSVVRRLPLALGPSFQFAQNH